MKTIELKVARIGNSRGVRLPAQTLKNYGVEDVLLMEERAEGLWLRRPGAAPEKLSWAETAKAMAASEEKWDEWDALDADGLEYAPWQSTVEHKAAEASALYSTRRRKGSPA